MVYLKKISFIETIQLIFTKRTLKALLACLIISMLFVAIPAYFGDNPFPGEEMVGQIFDLIGILFSGTFLAFSTILTGGLIDTKEGNIRARQDIMSVFVGSLITQLFLCGISLIF